MEQPGKIILSLGGASGSIYARRLMDKLKESYKSLEVGVVLSPNALINWELEIGSFEKEKWPFSFYEKSDFLAPFASGSARYTTMIVCPCSMGLLGRIAQGMSDDLTTRAADVILKERRKLILVPRETPYNLIHLRNMAALTEAGAIICPASPSFYHKPLTVTEVVDTVVDRILDLAGLPVDTKRWNEV
jgi:4-hydroxy-3-polyprenylbenzoate decarboxylase